MDLLKRHKSLEARPTIGSLLNQFLHDIEDEAGFESLLWNPSVDIREDKTHYIVCADLPGIAKKDIHLSLENNTLIIRGERHLDKEEEHQTSFRRERMHGQFYRRFTLPDSTDESKIEAKYKHGVLEVLIPKAAHARGREIDIRVED